MKIITQKEKKSLIVKDKKNKYLYMPVKIINQIDFLEQLKNWKSYQFNVFYELFDKICYSCNLKKHNWDNFKNGDLRIEIPTNLIFSKQQLKDYVFRIKNFEQTKKSLAEILNLKFKLQQEINGLPKVIMFPIFSKLEFDFNLKDKVIFTFNKELVNEIDNFLDSFRILYNNSLKSYKLSKLETRFRILLLWLRISQNDKENFNKNKKYFSIKDLYSILQVAKKTEIRNFTQTILKPIIKKLQETPYFKDLIVKKDKDKSDNKSLIGFEFIIPNFDFVDYEKQKRILNKEQEKKDIDKKIKDLAIHILGEK